MKLRWDPRALQDLNGIRAYLATNYSLAVAERVRKHLVARINRLRGNPYLGPTSDRRDIRILPPIRYPYRIYYTVRSKEVVILHIRHTSRRAPGNLVP